MDTKIPAIIFFALGIIFIVFNKQGTAGINWLDKKIWDEERRRRFPGHGGNNYEPQMVVFMGATEIVCAIFFWFISK